MRIAVLNLQSGIGITNGYRDYVRNGWRYVLPHSTQNVEEAGAMLAREAADLVLATEVEEVGLRSGFKSQPALLMERGGFTGRAFFPTRTRGSFIAEGNAILARSPIDSVRTHHLPTGVIPRLMGEAMLQIEGERVHAFVAHLGLRALSRMRQLARIQEILTDYDEPVIVGGDFNERNHVAFARLKQAGFAHVIALPTFPSWRPQHPLCVLFLSKHFSAPHAYIPEGPAFSDHLPLMVETSLRH